MWQSSLQFHECPCADTARQQGPCMDIWMFVLNAKEEDSTCRPSTWTARISRCRLNVTCAMELGIRQDTDAIFAMVKNRSWKTRPWRLRSSLASKTTPKSCMQDKEMPVQAQYQVILLYELRYKRTSSLW